MPDINEPPCTFNPNARIDAHVSIVSIISRERERERGEKKRKEKKRKEKKKGWSFITKTASGLAVRLSLAGGKYASSVNVSVLPVGWSTACIIEQTRIQTRQYSTNELELEYVVGLHCHTLLHLG